MDTHEAQPEPERPSGIFDAGERGRLPLALLIAANLIPLAAVFLFDWDAFQLILFYWFENLVVGFYNILKMAAVPLPLKRGGIFARVFTMLFFCIHYGGFCGGHGMFLLFFAEAWGGAPSGLDVVPDERFWVGPLVFIGLLVGVIQQLWALRPDGVLWPVIALMISHGYSFVHNFWIGGEWRTATMQKQMMQPYARIVIMHIAIIAGGALTMFLGSPLALLLLLILIKTYIDIRLHLREHRRQEG